MPDECSECQARIRREAAEAAEASRQAAEAAREAEREKARRENEARIAQHAAEVRQAGRRALARSGIPFGICLAVTIGLSLQRSPDGSFVALALPFSIASGILAGRTVTRLIVVRRRQAPWKINLDAAFGWQSMWAAIIVMAGTVYLAWSSLISAS